MRRERPVRRERPARHSRGFTLIEAIVTAALIGVLAALAMPYLIGKLREAKETRAISDLRAIEADLEAFQAEHGGLPDDLSGVGHEDKRDPWGYLYRYFAFKGAGWKAQVRKDRFLNPLNSTYDLYSIGPDGDTRKPLTPPPSWDDILRANNGEFMGPASEF